MKTYNRPTGEPANCLGDSTLKFNLKKRTDEFNLFGQSGRFIHLKKTLQFQGKSHDNKQQHHLLRTTRKRELFMLIVVHSC